MAQFLRTLLIYETNGFVALTYVLWEHLAGILVLGSFAFFILRAHAGQRAWIVGRPRDARTNRLSVCQFAARALGPPRARAAPPPSKTRHPAANRLLSATCSRASCARPRDARTRRLCACQFAARVWATAGPSHATSLQDPTPCGKPAVFRRGPAHHAPTCPPVLVRVPARRPNKAPQRLPACSRALVTAGPGRATSFQDPPPCGKPAAFRRGLAHIMRPPA